MSRWCPLLILATYNEAANLRIVVESAMKLVSPLHILIVDDNSPDGTGLIAEELSANHANAHVLHRPGKLGLAAALVAGFQWALEKGCDPIVNMDADGSHDSSHLAHFLQQLENADLVIGSRYLEPSGIQGWDVRRVLLSRAAGMYVRAWTGTRLTDPTSGYRGFRARALRAVLLRPLRSRGFVAHVEMLCRSVQLGHKIEEISITFKERATGVSKLSLAIIAEALFLVPLIADSSRSSRLKRRTER